MEIIHGEPLGPRVTAVYPKDDYILLLDFNNGEQRVFDAKHLFAYHAFAPLQNKQFFNLVRAVAGTIAWPNDIDYCPDTLYAQSKPMERDG
jgi:hypothetical protein